MSILASLRSKEPKPHRTYLVSPHSANDGEYEVVGYEATRFRNDVVLILEQEGLRYPVIVRAMSLLKHRIERVMDNAGLDSPIGLVFRRTRHRVHSFMWEWDVEAPYNVEALHDRYASLI